MSDSETIVALARAKPCPFCNSVLLRIEYESMSLRVCCRTCFAKGPTAKSGDPHRLHHDGREYKPAVDAWNQRRRKYKASKLA
jgi:hypothetical protein